MPTNSKMDNHNEPRKTHRDSNPHHSAFVDRPWLLLAFLFLVAGAAGIPAIWASRAFSDTAKTILTILVSLYTLVLLAIIGLVLVWAYHQALTLLA